MNRPHFRRRPRPTDPEPFTRYDAQWKDVLAAEAPGDEWSSLPPVFAPHTFVGGDLAAMAAPADYGEGYDIETEATLLEVNADALTARNTFARPATIRLAADVSRFTDAMARAQAAITAAAKPHGRHRQTNPLDLILADLRDIEDRLS